MKKVTDLGENEAIHCKTEEEASAICQLMHDAGLVWKSGRSYSTTTEWSTYKSSSCYLPKRSKVLSLGFCEKEGCTVYPASYFIEESFEYGEEVFVGEYENGGKWYKRIFVAKNPRKNTFIAVDLGGGVGVWNFIRKIPKEEPAQEMTIEQIEKELGKKIKIVK